MIVGAHSHDLLPRGERVGRVVVTQAGSFGDHLGRIEIDAGSVSASVVEVGDAAPHPKVLAEADRIEAEVADALAEEIGVADDRLDAAWIAGMLRTRMHADVGLFPDGLTNGALPPGPVTRGALWTASPSSNNPGVVELTGRQLRALLERAADPAFSRERPRVLRGRARGRLHVAGIAPRAIDDARTYSVAGSDFVLDPYGGYVDPGWRLAPRYDFPVTIREAIEDYFGRV